MKRALTLGLTALVLLSGCERFEWRLGKEGSDGRDRGRRGVVAEDERERRRQAEAEDEAQAEEPPAPIADLAGGPEDLPDPDLDAPDASEAKSDVFQAVAPTRALPARNVGEEDSIAIVGARIVTMNGAVIPKGTVLIENGEIAEVGAKVAVPDGIPVFDAAGMTVIPGLADMHVHHWSEREAPLYVANGITTVRNMWGTLQTQRLAVGAAMQDHVGPQIFTSGPLMDGPEPIWGDASLVVTNPEMARGAVRAQKAAGFDAVKLYEKLTPELFRAAVDEAKAQQLQVWAHTPIDMGVTDVVRLKVDSIEHLNDVDDALVPEGFRTPDGQLDYLARWAAIDEADMPALARLFAENRVASSATLSVTILRYERMLDADAFFAGELGGYVDSSLKDWWLRSAEETAPKLSPRLVAAARAKQLAFVRALHEARAPLLIGTDTPNPFVVQGFSIHDEMEMFVEAGLTEAEVLEIATRGAAAFLRAENSFGRIAAGLRGDVVVVNGDPLTDLSVLRRPEAVVLAGRLYDRNALDGMLERARNEAAATFTSPL